MNVELKCALCYMVGSALVVCVSYTSDVHSLYLAFTSYECSGALNEVRDKMETAWLCHAVQGA